TSYHQVTDHAMTIPDVGPIEAMPLAATSTAGRASTALVVLPTYNELENLEKVVRSVLMHGYDVLVVDDNSADGTGQLADKLASSSSHVQVVHRSHKMGLGSAYIAGFEIGLQQGYRYMLEMDADGSHQAADL